MVDYRVINQAATAAKGGSGGKKLAELHKEERRSHLEGNLRIRRLLLPGEVIIDQPFAYSPYGKVPSPYISGGKPRRAAYWKEVFTPEEELKKLLGE